MANTEYKKTKLARGYLPASSVSLSDPALLRRPPFAAAHRSQDSVLDGRRLLASCHGGASGEWLVDNTATGGITQVKPDGVTWREVHRVRTEQAPGQAVTVRCLAARSGASEYLAPGSTYENAGNTAAIKIELDWTNTAAQTSGRTVQWGLPGTGDADGLEGTDPGDVWQSLIHKSLTVYPGEQNQALTDGERVKWGDWPTVDIVISHRGGVRAIHTSATELADDHVSDHQTTATGVNGYSPEPIVWPVGVRKPLEREAHGATYEEHRYGTYRLLYVAERQTARVGPRLARWSAYDEVDAEPTDTTPDPVQVTSTTWVRVSWGHASANTAWDADAPGFDLPQTRRAPENLSSRVDGAASSPVRLRAYCRYSGTGTATGYLRVQSSPRSWIDLEIDQTTVGTTWQWLTITGWLETAVTGDDGYVVVQDFAKTSANTLEIREWELSYCDYEVGA